MSNQDQSVTSDNNKKKQSRPKRPFFEQYNEILPVVKKVYFYGTHAKETFDCPRDRYDKIRKAMKYVFRELMYEEKKAIRLSHDYFEDPQRAFLKLFLLKSYTSSTQLMYICLVLNKLRKNSSMTSMELDYEVNINESNPYEGDDDTPLKKKRTRKKIVPAENENNSNKEKKYEKDDISGYLKGALEIMTRYGILNAVKEKNNNLYSIADFDSIGKKLLDETREELLPLVDLCTNIFPISICGGGIRSKLDIGYESPFLFKYKFMAQYLDDEKTWKLLLAASLRRVLKVEFLTTGQKEKMLLSQFIPYRIITDEKTGRQYVFGACLGESKHKNYFVRIDTIQTIEYDEARYRIPEIATLEEWYHDENDHSFTGIAVKKKLQKGILIYDAAISSEVKKRFPGCKPMPLDDDLVRLELEVQDIWGLKPWLCSYADKMLLFNSSDSTAENVRNTFQKWNALYSGTEDESESMFLIPDESQNTITEKNELQKKKGNSGDLFDLPLSNEFNNFFSLSVVHVLNDMCGKTTTERDFIRDLYFTAEDDDQLFKDEIDNLIKKIHVLVDTESQDKWSRGKSSIIPLCYTIIERIYLKAILRTRYSRIFLSEQHRNDLLDRLRDLPDIDLEETCVMAPPVEKEDFSDEYIANLNFVINAIRNKKEVTFSLRSADGKASEITGYPVRVEYCADSDSFILLLLSEEEKMPERADIKDMSVIKRTGRSWEIGFPIDEMRNRMEENSIVVELTPEKGNYDRARFAFSLYNSKIYDLDNGKYRFEIRYYSFDREEIINKLCSFGESVKVLSPGDIVQEIAEMPEKHDAFVRKVENVIRSEQAPVGE